MKPVDFIIFVDCLQQALPALLLDLKDPNFHYLTAQRRFFQKEFDLLALFSLYFPEKSRERELCKSAILQWQLIDFYLAKTPLELPDLQEKLSSLENHLQKLLPRSSSKRVNR